MLLDTLQARNESNTQLSMWRRDIIEWPKAVCTLAYEYLKYSVKRNYKKKLSQQHILKIMIFFYKTIY